MDKKFRSSIWSEQRNKSWIRTKWKQRLHKQDLYWILFLVSNLPRFGSKWYKLIKDWPLAKGPFFSLLYSVHFAVKITFNSHCWWHVRCLTKKSTRFIIRNKTKVFKACVKTSKYLNFWDISFLKICLRVFAGKFCFATMAVCLQLWRSACNSKNLASQNVCFKDQVSVKSFCGLMKGSIQEFAKRPLRIITLVTILRDTPLHLLSVVRG